jgi:hypothetical protein
MKLVETTITDKMVGIRLTNDPDPANSFWGRRNLSS